MYKIDVIFTNIYIAEEFICLFQFLRKALGYTTSR